MTTFNEGRTKKVFSKECFVVTFKRLVFLKIRCFFRKKILELVQRILVAKIFCHFIPDQIKRHYCTNFKLLASLLRNY